MSNFNPFNLSITLPFSIEPMWWYNIKRFLDPRLYPKLTPFSIKRRVIKNNWTPEMHLSFKELDTEKSILDIMREEINDFTR